MKKECLRMSIYIVVFVGFVLLFSGCISGPTNNPAINTSINNNSAAPGNNVSTAPGRNVSAAPGSNVSTAPGNNSALSPQTGVIKCELCHTNPQSITPHVNGGKYCINCHGSQVHNIHVGLGTINLDCTTCHGFPPKIPTIQKGEGPGHYIVCENCHAPPPDSLKPSLGNLVVIHLSRGKYCTNCHGTDVGVIHAAALANMTKTANTGTTANTTNIAGTANTTNIVNTTNTTNK